VQGERVMSERQQSVQGERVMSERQQVSARREGDVREAAGVRTSIETCTGI
jgi:hypothetical protein